MASGGEQITGSAVEALLGVVTLDADASEGDDAVVRLAEAVRAAADAPGIAVWIQDHRLDRGRLVVSAGAAEEAWEAVAAAADAARSDEAVEVGPGDGALPAALAATGTTSACGTPAAASAAGRAPSPGPTSTASSERAASAAAATASQASSAAPADTTRRPRSRR